MKKELTEEEYINHSLKANQPKIFFPILNSIISIILFGTLIYFFVKREINLGFLIFGIIVIILFPLSSWYSSYFSKIKATKRINDFKEETESLVKYAQTFKGFKIIENDHLAYNIISGDSINQNATFNRKDCLVNGGKITGTLIAYGASFIGLDVNVKTKKVVNVTGMLPTSIWFEKRLTTPLAQNGILEINDNLSQYTVIQSLTNANAYYDKRTGWVCIGDRKSKERTNIKIMNNVIISLNNQEVTAFWINVGILADNKGKDKDNEN